MTSRILLRAAGVLALAGCLTLPLRAADEVAAAPAPAAGGAAHIDDDHILAAARAADLFYQQHFERLIDLLGDKDPATVIAAIRALGALHDPAATPFLMPRMQASTNGPDILCAAMQAISSQGAENALPMLRALLKNGDATVRVTALNTLSRIKAVDANDYKSRSEDPSAPLRASARTDLGTLAIADAAPILAKGLAGDHPAHIRRMCAIGLGNLGDKTQAPVLTDALSDGDDGVRRYAAEALVKLDYKPAIPVLLMALEANVAGAHLARCLTILSGQDFGFDPRADQLKREAAIERGFAWWGVNAKDLLLK